MKRYEYRCECGKQYESEQRHDAPCPECAQVGRRVYASITPLYHPSKGRR